MNRGLDGRLLTQDDLAEMALAHGALTPKALQDLTAASHGSMLSELWDVTRKVREDLFWAKRALLLDTSTREVSTRARTTDPEVARQARL